MNHGHIFGLDLIRALAVLMVLAAHASLMFMPGTSDLATLEPWLLAGLLGVELFFVLSGFLIGGILAAEAARGPLQLRRFWIRRWLRTLPNYYLFLGLNILLERVLQGEGPDAWHYLVFLQNLAWPNPPFFPESWSLAIEELFYLAAPLLIVAGRLLPLRRISPPLLVLLGIGVFTLIRIGWVLLFDPSWDAGVRKVALVRLDAIAFGVLAVVAVRHFRPGLAVIRIVAGLGSLGTIACLITWFVLPRDSDFFARTLWFNLVPLSFAAFLPLAARWQGASLPAWWRTLVHKIALWSYALYISHLFVQRILLGVLDWKGETFMQCLLQATAFCLLAIATSALVYHGYERPWLRLRDRLAPRAPSASGLYGATAPRPTHSASS